ncbi:MAG: hypothetical protein AAGH41_04790 [Pseudomonadota bacterium]
MKRPEKKSESLEIRLPYSQKRAFMEACRERGVTASDTLRQFIADDIEALERANAPRTWSATVRNNPLKTAAGAAGAALAAAALGTAPSFADDDVFSRFDRNGDQQVSYSEFLNELGSALGQPAPPAPAGVAAPLPPAPGDTHERLFSALDADGSGALTTEEFAPEDEIFKRTDNVLAINGQETRLLGVEFYTYDLTERGSVSVKLSALNRPVGRDASKAEVEAVFRALEDEARTMKAPSAPAAPPTR